MSKPTIELNQLRLLAQTQAGTTYAKIIEEVLSYVFLVRSWKKVPTSGCAIPHYTPFGAEYEVWYQEGNLANIVHELTHIACHVGYDNNFLCYHATDAKSIRKYEFPGETGRITNQEELQIPNMTALRPLLDMGQTIKSAVAVAGLSKEKTKQITDKIEYGTGQHSGVEFDPCVNNVLGWLVEWGYPKRPGRFTHPNNQVFNVTEQVAYSQYKKRTGKV